MEEPAGQFVPFARQTFCPIIRSDDPEAEVNAKVVAVALVANRLEMVPLVAWKFDANRFVLVVFVPVAFVHVRFVKLDGDAPETVRFVKFAFVAKRFVDVLFVDVTFVKTPVDGVAAPIEVPLIVPPVTVIFCVVKLLMLLVNALIVVPLAVA